MRSRKMRALEVLSISALDLFASALGVFILMSVLLFPFYLKSPSVEAAVDGARAESSNAHAALEDMRTRVADAEEKRRQAEARLAKAASEQEEAAEDLAAATEAARAVQIVQPKPKPKTSAPKKRLITIGDLDLVFVMDATGSMRDEIADVQRSMLSIIRVLEQLAPSLQVGFVAFKDRTDPYVTQAYPLNPMTATNLKRIQGFVRSLHAHGGGDKPEPVGAALRVAVQMKWRPNALGRIVVIGDAPAHSPDWKRTFELAAGFRRSSPPGNPNRRVSGIFTGNNRPGRDFYTRLARAGGGDLITHRGRIMESVMLSILDGAR